MHTLSEENYLKAILKLSEKTNEQTVSTNAIALECKIKASSVTVMLKRLSDKGLIHYVPYKGVELTDKGLVFANGIRRKHRLWEVFLVDTLKFNEDEVHEIAEQLEHINSASLIDKLDAFLGFPTKDPHGGEIPTEQVKNNSKPPILLVNLDQGSSGQVISYDEQDQHLVEHIKSLGIRRGKIITVLSISKFDDTINIGLDNKTVYVSSKLASKIKLTQNG